MVDAKQTSISGCVVRLFTGTDFTRNIGHDVLAHVYLSRDNFFGMKSICLYSKRLSSLMTWSFYDPTQYNTYGGDDVAEKNIEIYTDGACSGNPGPGGWAAVVTYGNHVKEISGGELHTTNQRMEMMAVYQALHCLKEACNVTVYSDSAYVINCFTQKWYVNWQKNGWRNSKGEPVQNRDLWEQLLIEVARHHVTFAKVKGHAGVELNERCDALARGAVPN